MGVTVMRFQLRRRHAARVALTLLSFVLALGRVSLAPAATQAQAPSADLEVAKVASPDPVAAGGKVTYTITVTNNGPDTATGVAILDALASPPQTFLPAESSPGCAVFAAFPGVVIVACPIPDLAAGASASVTIVVEIDVGLLGVLPNGVFVGGDQFDPDPVNNEATITVTVNEPCLPDTTAPTVSAALVPVGDGDEEEDDDDEGRFRVEFSAIDECDTALDLEAVLIVPGLAPITVTNGQVIEFEMDDEDAEAETEDGLVEIEGPALTLRVTATDASGNRGVVEAEPTGLSPDNDDETDDDD